MTERHKVLSELLAKVEEMRGDGLLTRDDFDSISRILKGNLTRQAGPAKGQKFWIDNTYYTDSSIYEEDDFDLNLCKFQDPYPEARFAEAELRARKLIVAVNKRRRELNEGKEFWDRRYYINFWDSPRMDAQWSSRQVNVLGLAYPFGLFKESEDCKKCIHEFEDELEWFFSEYLTLMAELDEYDWADAPSWGEEDTTEVETVTYFNDDRLVGIEAVAGSWKVSIRRMNND